MTKQVNVTITREQAESLMDGLGMLGAMYATGIALLGEDTRHDLYAIMQTVNGLLDEGSK